MKHVADWAADNPQAAWRVLDCADACDSLAAFCGMIEIPGAPIGEEPDDAADFRFEPIETPVALHHKLLLEKLQKVEEGEIRRLMIFMPPGAGKSVYASVVFPSWFMAKKKRRNVIVATYASDLGRKIGRRMRSIVRQPVYREIFKTGLSAESSAADEWALDNGNEFMSGGILSGITGNRADGIVCDDLVKNRQDADSDTLQKRTKEEYDATITTRLKPGGFVVLIMTRWSELDVAGQILPENWDGESGAIQCRDGLVWEVLCIPAEAEKNDPLGRKPGEMLWPEWFGTDPIFWTAQRQNPRNWAALYQQRPQPATGTYFMRAWFDGGEIDGRTYERKRYRPDQLPKDLRKYGTSDYAVTEDGGDFTVHRCWAVDEFGDIWLLSGGYRAQATSDKWIEAVIDQMTIHQPYAWFGEAGVIQKAIEPALLRRMKERDVMCRLEVLPSIQDKATRARGFQARAAMGTVHIPEGPEGDAILDEYIRFPAGRNDDDVDCVVGGTLVTMADGSRKPIEEIKIGQRVLTPLGSGAVSASQRTIRNARVMRLQLSTGETLLATPNHPIACTQDGFVRMDMVSIGDRVIVERERCQKQLFSTGGLTVDTQKVGTHITRITSKLLAARDSCTVMFGRMQMAQFQPALSFTTSTATRSTTALKTSRAFLQKSIAASIQCGVSGLNSRLPTWRESDRSPLSGTGRRRGALGTLRTQNARGPIGQSERSRVNAAVAVSLQNTAAATGRAVLLPALSAIGIAGWCRMLTTVRRLAHKPSAPTADRYSTNATRSARSSATFPASEVIALDALEKREDVFNLTVEGENVFYANGILTHNCGSMIGRALDMAHPAIVKPEPKTLEMRGVSNMTFDEMMAQQDRRNGSYNRIA
jgi:predicted phage terminase large subunit-like protein